VPSSYRVRDRISKKDDPFLLNLIKENLRRYPSAEPWTDERILDMLNKSSRVLILVSEKDQCLGFLSWIERMPTLRLGLCVLDQNIQEQGIAKRYYRKLETSFRKKGFTRIELYVDKLNTRAIKLYQYLGFRKEIAMPFAKSILMYKKLI
jgi:ribosomal protein S18 acetylase RimI-like enzyme